MTCRLSEHLERVRLGFFVILLNIVFLVAYILCDNILWEYELEQLGLSVDWELAVIRIIVPLYNRVGHPYSGVGFLNLGFFILLIALFSNSIAICYLVRSPLKEQR